MTAVTSAVGTCQYW